MLECSLLLGALEIDVARGSTDKRPRRRKIIRSARDRRLAKCSVEQAKVGPCRSIMTPQVCSMTEAPISQFDCPSVIRATVVRVSNPPPIQRFSRCEFSRCE
jgi:hypothetical protein